MYGLRQPKPQVSQALALPPPVGGINDLDPLATMGPEFMIDGMNFFPDTGTLNVRSGYQVWVGNVPGGAVKTIMSYNTVDGSFRVFACTDTGIYNVTASVDVAPLVKAVTNGQMEWTNFATAAGQYLIACNGQQTVFANGLTWGNFTQVTTPAAPGEIKGVNPNTFNFVLVHKGRLWFLQTGSLTAWYLPIDSVGGEAKPFFLGGLFKRGGYLISLARWSMDTGEGLDDRIIFLSSAGEIASYSGNDPSNAADWTLDSIFFIAPPLGPRAIVDFGGDILFLSRRGLVPLSVLVQGVATDVMYSSVMSKRISRTLINLTAPTSPRFPIEIGFQSELALITINIYDERTQAPLQLVMNLLTGAWGKFNYPVRTIRSVDRSVFMGTDDGRVLVVTMNRHVDNVPRVGVGGDPIEAYAFSAYSYLDDPTTNKHAKFIRPIFHTEVKPSFRIRALPDFRLDTFLATPIPNFAVGNAIWDVSFWDTVNWAGLENVYRPWVSANVLGYAFAWQLRVSTSSPLSVAAMEWVWESGGLI